MRSLRIGNFSIWVQYLYSIGSDTREADGYNSYCGRPTLKVDIEVCVLEQCRKISGELYEVVFHNGSPFGAFGVLFLEL